MAIVLSTMNGTATSCATAAMVSRSSTSPRGLPIVSPKNALVFGWVAARHWSGSFGSATKETSMPSFGKLWRSRLSVPPYRLELATMWSPASATLVSAPVVAACPDASSSAPTPPSSAASRCSTTSCVGLMMRV